VTGTTPPQDELRAQLVQTIATVNLLLARWCEPPSTGGIHLSTLVQQILSMIAQHGGVTPLDAYRTLCAHGPFEQIDQQTFGTLLRDLGTTGLLRQERDGLLLHDQEGERLVNHHTFFAAFASPTEYRLVTEGRTLGTLPSSQPLHVGGLLIFSGRRWKILTLDSKAKVIELIPASGGRLPKFLGGAADVHDRIRTEMRRVYESADVPVYLDAMAQRLLAEARAAYQRFGLAECPLLGWGNDTLLFPFRGDTAVTVLALALHERGVSIGRDGLALSLAGTSPDRAADLLAELAATPPPDPRRLAALVPDKILEKYDDVIGDELLTTAYAARKLDVATAWSALPDLSSAAKAGRLANPAKVRQPD
jgi:ATP-dependent Lhr-like helicase